MEKFILILLSVNKISLIAFLVILSFLLYEVYLIRKEKQKRQRPNVPTFDPSKKVELAEVQVIQDKAPVVTNLVNKFLIVILSIMLVVFGVITVLSAFSLKKVGASNNEPKVIIEEVTSRGIKIFDERWKEKGNEEIKLLKPFDKIIIGVETVADSDVDKARIKINQEKWQISDITTKFNKQYKMFYQEYQIASDEYKLKIDGQLHSKQDGWLGD